MAHVLTDEEFDAVDACCVASKLQDDGFYLSGSQDGAAIFFVDNGERLGLDAGLEVLADGVELEDLAETGEMTDAQVAAVMGLFERFGIAY